MGIVIKKRVDLDFLGDDYKEAYLVFKAMPVKDYESFTADVDKVEDKDSVRFLLNKLKENFVGGKFPGDDGMQDLKADDLEDFDAETIIKAFQTYTGVSPDPKS